jgi:phosphoglycerate dehydrogenase-like enzyme
MGTPSPTPGKISGKYIFLGPEKEKIFINAIESAGCEVVPEISQADGIVWFGRDPVALESLVTPNVKWIQIPDAGAEKWIATPIASGGILVTCASGIYGHQVAEHTLALILGCARRLEFYARQTKWNPSEVAVLSLSGKKVLIVGAGGIGVNLVAMLKPLQCYVTVMSKSGRKVPEADQSATFDDFLKIVGDYEVIVLAAPATPETYHMINADSLSRMKPETILVNVARGSLINSEDLLKALDAGVIAGAGLDVTDPEPLAEGHRFFTHPKMLLTPHIANPPSLKKASFARHVEANCLRFLHGETLVGIIDLERGY